jgi:hypothetical protein
MAEHKIEASKVTKPIQLLAAWLTGLVVINASFLTAAARLDHPSWASGLLVISAVLNVPIFLIGLFLLQTKFRPEMQEDEFYSKYLEKRFSIDSKTDEIIEVRGKASIENFQAETAQIVLSDKKITEDFQVIENPATIVTVNDLLPSFEALTKELISKNVEINSTFGSTSTDPEAPDIFHVSFGDNVDIKILKTILLVCKKYELHSISYASGKTAKGKIYIGSLGYQNNKRKVAIATPELMSEISQADISISRLKSILIINGISSSLIKQ